MNPVLSFIVLVCVLFVTSCTESNGLSGGDRGGILSSIVNTSLGGSIEEEVPEMDDTASLDKLIGRVDFRYRFNLVAEDYIDTFTYSQENRVNVEGQERLYTETFQKSYVCGVLTASRYMCLIFSFESQVVESYLFSLGSNGQGSGNYEFCTWEEAQTDCGNEVVENPDGTVDVTVNATLSAQGTPSFDSMLISADELNYKLVSEQSDAPGYTVAPLRSDQALVEEISRIMRSATSVPR